MKSAFKKFRQHHQHHHGLYWPPQQQLLLPSSPPQPKPSSSSSLHPNHASALAGPPPKFYGLSSEMDNEINDDEGCIVISVGAPLPSTVTTADEDDEEDGCPI